MQAFIYLAVKIAGMIKRPTEPQSFLRYAKKEPGKEVLTGMESIFLGR